MSVVQEFNLNIIPDSAPVIIHVDQSDYGEGRLKANLYNGDTPYAPVGASALIQGTKPDGTFYMYSCEMSGNVVTANLERIMTQVPGRVKAQFVITDSEDRTGTFVFWIDVQATALSTGGSSESIIEYIEEAIKKTQEEAEISESWAKGTKNDEPVSEDDPAYHNNSKHYSEESKAQKEDSEAWAKGTRNGVPVSSDDETYHNNAEYWADCSEAAAENIAPIEEPVAQHAYAVGKQFIVNGTLYTATSAIAVNDEIVPGTNCSVSSKIVDQMALKADLVDDKVPAAQLSNISKAAVTEITEYTTPDYPVPQADDLLKVIIGKIKKFLSDLKAKKTDLTNIATVESSTTASRPYAVGDHLILDGQYYVVTTAISQGGTIVTSGSGQNVDVDTVSSGLRNKAAASAGTDLSLVTTGEKYTWNGKQPKTLDTPLTIDGTQQTTVEGALGAFKDQSFRQYIQTTKSTSGGVDSFVFTGLSLTPTTFIDRPWCDVKDAGYLDMVVSGDTITVKYNSSDNVSTVALRIW